MSLKRSQVLAAITDEDLGATERELRWTFRRLKVPARRIKDCCRDLVFLGQVRDSGLVRGPADDVVWKAVR